MCMSLCGFAPPLPSTAPTRWLKVKVTPNPHRRCGFHVVFLRSSAFICEIVKVGDAVVKTTKTVGRVGAGLWSLKPYIGYHFPDGSETLFMHSGFS